MYPTRHIVRDSPQKHCSMACHFYSSFSWLVNPLRDQTLVILPRKTRHEHPVVLVALDRLETEHMYARGGRDNLRRHNLRKQRSRA